MTKKVAFVFTQTPHGTSAGREGLDAVLAASAYSEEVGLFFIADGVFQLLPQQRPDRILARDYIATFGVLPLYDISDCFVCSDSLRERGLTYGADWAVDSTPLDGRQIAKKIAGYDTVLLF